MSFTPQNVIDEAKERLGLSTDDTELDTQFLNWVQSCHTELDAELSLLDMGWTATTGTVDRVAGTDEYTLPTGTVMLTAVHWLDGDVYRVLPERQILRATAYNTDSPNISQPDKGFFFSGTDTIKIRGVTNESVTDGLKFVSYPDTTRISLISSTISDTELSRLVYTIYLCKTYEEMVKKNTAGIFHIKWANPANPTDGVFNKWRAIMRKRMRGVKTIDNMMDMGS